MKGEYIEEVCDTIKLESADLHGDSPFAYNQHFTPPSPWSPFISITPLTPSLQTFRIPITSPFYPIPPYPPMYPTKQQICLS